MRYKLDANGYVESVFWGCYSNGCAEYTGTVPSGYTDLNDWSTNALINAYYINEAGNLTLDEDRLAEIEARVEQETIDNEPILRKDLYGTTNVLETQYKSEIAAGQVIAIDNVKKINPKVKITNVNTYDKIEVITQTRNMLVNDGKSETISGVTFTRNNDGSIYISGTATANIEYNLAGSGTNTTSIFVLKKDLDYFLNVGGLECIMNFYDGTTSQVYTGYDGVINLNESKEVTQVLIKIPTGTVIDKTIYPMLEYGSTASEFEVNDSMKLTIDISNYASADYISIEDGLIYVSSNNELSYLGKGNVNLFDGYNTVYTLQDTSIEMTYFINDMNLEGTSTANNSFRIDEEGNITATGGTIGGFTLTKNSLSSDLTPPETIPNYDYDYTEQDVTNIKNYLLNGGTLTEEQMILYDLDQDGKVDLLDYSRVWKLVLTGVSHAHPGKLEINTNDPLNTIVLRDKNGNEIVNISLNGIQINKGIPWDRHIVTARLEENYTIVANNTYEVLPLFEWLSVGDKLFARADGNIEIGAGVNHIKVNGNVRYRAGAVGQKYLTIFRNFDQLEQIVTYRASTSGGTNISATGAIFPVSEGDLIRVSVYGAAGDSIAGNENEVGQLMTFLTVEVID